MPLARKDDIEYEEKKAKRYRVNDKEFYVIDDIEEAQSEAGFSVKDLGAEGKRSTKRIYHALIVHDPDFGTMPYHIWEEKMKRTVLGTISTHGDVPHMDMPHVDSIAVSASGYMTGGNTCRNCGKLIPFNESRCLYCGTLSPATG